MAIRDINLIDSGILTRRYMLRHLVLWAGGLMVTLALIGGFYGFQLRTGGISRHSRESLKKIHARLEARIKTIKDLQVELETVRRRQSALETVTNKRPFYQILVKLAGMMNQDTWITQLALSDVAGKTPGNDLKLTGFSRSNEALGNFMNRLDSEPMFNAVVLQFARENETAASDQAAAGAVPRIQFQITCTIARG
jgi:Tfp pilus assembly protein PilN